MPAGPASATYVVNCESGDIAISGGVTKGVSSLAPSLDSTELSGRGIRFALSNAPGNASQDYTMWVAFLVSGN